MPIPTHNINMYTYKMPNNWWMSPQVEEGNTSPQFAVHNAKKYTSGQTAAIVPAVESNIVVSAKGTNKRTASQSTAPSRKGSITAITPKSPNMLTRVQRRRRGGKRQTRRLRKN